MWWNIISVSTLDVSQQFIFNLEYTWMCWWCSSHITFYIVSKKWLLFLQWSMIHYVWTHFEQLNTSVWHAGVLDLLHHGKLNFTIEWVEMNDPSWCLSFPRGSIQLDWTNTSFIIRTKWWTKSIHLMDNIWLTHY